MLNYLENFNNILKKLFKLRNMFHGNMFFDGLPSQMGSSEERVIVEEKGVEVNVELVLLYISRFRKVRFRNSKLCRYT
jgi:hypothetical protein